MTSLLNYLNNSSYNSTPSISSSLENSSPSYDLKPSAKFIIQPPCDAQKHNDTLSKRLNTTELGDLITKKLKTKSTNVSSNASLEHSPLSKRNLNLNENTNSKTTTTDGDRSMTIEGSSDEETSTIRSCGKAQILIPPFEVDSLLSGESTTGSTRSLSKEPSTELIRSSTDFSLFGQKSDQESAIQLSNALEILKLRLMAHDEERLRDGLIQILLAQEPVSIPSFTEINLMTEAVPVKKVENEFDVTYGEVEFPFLSLSVPYEESQDKVKSSLSELLTKNDKPSVMFDDLSTPSKLSKKSSMLSEDDKRSKRDKRDSLAATRAGTQKSSCETENATKKIKKEKKSLSIMDDSQAQKKTNVKIAENENKERIQSFMAQEGYSTIMNSKKSRSERQRTRWQLAQDENFTIGDYLTYLISGDQKKAKVPIGTEYQVDVSNIPFKQSTGIRRQLKQKWDPKSHSQSELQSLVKGLKTCLKTQVSQEQAIDVLTRNGNDIKKALNYAKNNKAKCLAELAARTAANLTP